MIEQPLKAHSYFCEPDGGLMTLQENVKYKDGQGRLSRYSFVFHAPANVDEEDYMVSVHKSFIRTIGQRDKFKNDILREGDSYVYGESVMTIAFDVFVELYQFVSKSLSDSDTKRVANVAS